MLENLQERLSSTMSKLSKRSKMTDGNISEALRDVRVALLEADVALPVVKLFLGQIRSKALGSRVTKSLNPGQQLVKIVQTELEIVLGENTEPLNLAQKPPAVILLAGLQGAGKTTSAAKLAQYIKQKENKSVLLASVDVYRPAAIEQLAKLAEDTETDFFVSDPSKKPVDLANEAIKQARNQHKDVLIIDTAGRLAVDDAMMEEIKALHKTLDPVETLFVIDAMTGQDAANTAKAFGDALPLTGVILTKMDGDARGGAALSVKHITGKPIKFMGMGEKIEALEIFHPQRIASRVLGMGDMLSLIEEVESKVDKDKAQKMLKKLQSKKPFDLEDMRDQLQQMNNMGGMGSILDKIPGMADAKLALENKDTQQQFSKMEALINSMTVAERRNPDLLNGSRKRRITNGSGTTIQDLARLLKQYKNMAKMTKKMGGGGMGKMMRKLGGAMPGGAMPDMSQLQQEMEAPNAGQGAQPSAPMQLGADGLPNLQKKKSLF